MITIMSHYRHLLRWISSSNELPQLNNCRQAIEAFEHTHRKNVAVQLLASDLHTLCSNKSNSIAAIGLLNLEQELKS